MLFAPVGGLLFTLMAMVQTFNSIAMGSDTPDRDVLASSIHGAIIATEIGLAIAFMGCIFVCIALGFYHYLAPWFWRTLIWASGVALLCWPVGTVVGIIAIVLLVLKRDLFYAVQPA